jgi:hypothetical protein
MSEYELGKLKQMMDRLGELERLVYDRKLIVASMIGERLAHSEPLQRIANIPDIECIVLSVEPMYDSTDIEIEIKLMVQKLDTDDEDRRWKYLSAIEDAARLYLHECYAKGVAEYVHIRTVEADNKCMREVKE